MHLSAAANLLALAYLSILSKGYAVQVEGGLMVAVRGADRFSADGPVELLGVIAVAETRGENWQATDEEIDDFLSRFG